MEIDDKTSIHQKSSKRLHWQVVVLIAVVLLLSVWFLSPTGAIQGPVHLQRSKDGELEVVGKNNLVKNTTVDAKLAVVDSSTSKSTATSTSHSDPGWFQASRLILLNKSDHLLMNRVGRFILEELRKSSNWNDILYLPSESNGFAPLPASDVFMTVDLNSISETGIVNKDLKADLQVTIGTSIVSSNHTVHDSMSPPTVRFFSSINLEHRSTLTGIESAGAKYSLQGEQIAKELLDTLNKLVEDIQEKHGPPPIESGRLLAEYREIPDFEFLNGKKPLLSSHGWMLHNETVWTLDDLESPKKFLEATSQNLQEQGWKEYTKQYNEHTKYLRMQKESKWLELMPEKQRFQVPNKNIKETPSKWYLRYRERMSREKANEIYEQLLNDSPTNIELLLSLQRLATGEQREKLFTLVEANPPSTANGWIKLAEWYALKKQQDKLLNALRHANLRSLFVKDRSGSRNKIEKILKKNELSKEEISQLDVSILEEAGVGQLSKDSPTLIKEFKTGEPIAFYIPGETTSEWKYIAASVESEQGGYRVGFRNGNQLRSEGSSWLCCISLNRPQKEQFTLDDGIKVELELRKIKEDQFEAKAQYNSNN